MIGVVYKKIWLYYDFLKMYLKEIMRKSEEFRWVDFLQ